MSNQTNTCYPIASTMDRQDQIYTGFIEREMPTFNFTPDSHLNGFCTRITHKDGQRFFEHWIPADPNLTKALCYIMAVPEHVLGSAFLMPDRDLGHESKHRDRYNEVYSYLATIENEFALRLAGALYHIFHEQFESSYCAVIDKSEYIDVTTCVMNGDVNPNELIKHLEEHVFQDFPGRKQYTHRTEKREDDMNWALLKLVGMPASPYVWHSYRKAHIAHLNELIARIAEMRGTRIPDSRTYCKGVR